jgi:carboxymethylenebutenolidase
VIIKDSEFVDLPTAFGPMRTYIYRPVAEGKYPGIVLFSEIFQVTGPIRRTAAMLAGHGYVVAVPEIFHDCEGQHGCVIPYDTAGADRGNKHKITKELASYDADARAALDYLKSHPACTGKLGVAGICIGGHLSFRAAAMNPDVRAAVCWYATDLHKKSLSRSGDDTLSRCGQIAGELLMIWGRQDPHVPLEGRRMIHAALSEANVNFTWHEFNGQHAFMRDEGHRYDPALARTCYDLALELFHRKLHDGDLPAAKTEAKAESRH